MMQGFPVDLESNNADCGDLIDLMKTEREPSTILCLDDVTCQGHRFSGTTPCLANIDLDTPLLGEPLVSKARKCLENPWGDLGQN